MDERKVNAFIATLVPPRGKEAVAQFIDAAVRALGGRSDSALARTMGVAPSTLASWKARGAIPDEQVTWFTSTLGAKIVAYRQDLSNASLLATAAVVRLLGRTSGDPLRIGSAHLGPTARSLGPMLAIADFIVAVEGFDPSDTSELTVDRVADTLEGGLFFERNEIGQLHGLRRR